MTAEASLSKPEKNTLISLSLCVCIHVNVHVCVCMYKCAGEHVPVCRCMWSPEHDVRCLPQLPSTLAFEAGALNGPVRC